MQTIKLFTRYLMPQMLFRFLTISLMITCFNISGAGIENAFGKALSIDKVKLENQLKTDLENTIIRNLNAIIKTGNILKTQAFTQLKSQAYSTSQKYILDAVNKDPEIKKMVDSQKESARNIYKQIIKTEPFGGDIKSVYTDYKTGQSKEIVQKLANEIASAKNRIAEIAKKAEGISGAMQDPDADYAAVLKKYGVGGKWVEKFEAQEKKLKKISKILDSKYGDYWSMYKMIHEGMEGNRPDKKIETLFKLMEGFGNKIPVLGNFVELYGKTALAMLEATNKLKNTLTKFDEGCVGVGAHLTFSAAPQQAFMDKYPGKYACPAGGIKNLYYNETLVLTGKLYFWTGSSWLHTDRGTGGVKILKKILTMLARSEARYGSDFAQSDIQTAFKLYDIDYPGGFNAIYNEAKTTLEKINKRVKRLEDFFVYSGGGSSSKFNNFIFSESQYNKKAIEEYLYQKFDLFAFRFIKGFIEGETGAYDKHKQMLKALEEIEFRIVWGRIKFPEKTIDDLAVSIKTTPNISVLDEIADGNKKEYAIIMNVHPGAMLTYKLNAGDIESKLIKYLPSKMNKIIRRDVELGQELIISLEFPDTINAHEKTKLITTIEGGEPLYDLTFTTSEGKTYERPGKKKGFEAKIKFKKAGPQWIKAIVTDKNGFTGEARVDFEVKEYFNVSLKSGTPEAKSGDKVRVDAKITGGIPPYDLSWTSSDGQSLFVTKDSTNTWIQITYADPGKHWVKLVVKDRNKAKPLTASAKLNLTINPEEFGAKLKLTSKKILPNQPMRFDLSITGGEPPYTISGTVSGVLQSQKGDLTITAPAEPGQYNVTIHVKDKKNLEVTARQLIEVPGPLSIELSTKNLEVKPNKVFKVNISIKGGIPPFTLSGIQNGLLQTRHGEFTHKAPGKEKKYTIRIKAVDKYHQTVNDQLTFEVKKMPDDQEGIDTDAITKEVSKTIEVPDPIKGLKGIDWGDTFDKAFEESSNSTLPEPTYNPDEMNELLGTPSDEDEGFDDEEKVIIINRP
ncbi:MAG: hypothetical protein GY699_10720 [Desulfobacteraceae bacterium]|nr:hypothetical protein [Desulfobacteraceae bacterium]